MNQVNPIEPYSLRPHLMWPIFQKDFQGYVTHVTVSWEVSNSWTRHSYILMSLFNSVDSGLTSVSKLETELREEQFLSLTVVQQQQREVLQWTGREHRHRQILKMLVSAFLCATVVLFHALLCLERKKKITWYVSVLVCGAISDTCLSFQSLN